MKRILALIICITLLLAALLAGCDAVPEAAVDSSPSPTAEKPAATAPMPEQTPTEAPTEAPTPEATEAPTPLPTPVKTTSPDDEAAPEEAAPSQTPEATETPTPQPTTAPEADAAHEAGTVRVRPGDTLSQNIIPRLCDAFGMDRDGVKDVLEDCRDSKLIHDELSDYRRMEGIIPPGTYDIAEDAALAEYVNLWIDQAEQRYDAILAACGSPNGLDAWEQMSLAAVVEWECLPNAYYEQTAAALLNRLDAGSKLRCCGTTEYALGYLRPYLTSEDIKIQSSYNTYVVRGVPIGPICVFEDECLRVSVAKSTDTSV